MLSLTSVGVNICNFKPPRVMILKYVPTIASPRSGRRRAEWRWRKGLGEQGATRRKTEDTNLFPQEDPDLQ